MAMGQRRSSAGSLALPKVVVTLLELLQIGMKLAFQQGLAKGLFDLASAALGVTCHPVGLRRRSRVRIPRSSSVPVLHGGLVRGGAE